MDFCTALKYLKEGQPVARRAWNKKKFIWLKPETIIEAVFCMDKMLKEIAEEYGDIKGKGVICMLSINHNDDAEIISGWTPNTEDLFANDWNEADISQNV